MRKLFGTDGIRAVAGVAPLDKKTIFAIGIALGHSLKPAFPEPTVVLGMDTRESGGWIAAVVAAGLERAGAKVVSAGVITTPAIAYLARKHKYAAGIVISASHNPWEDNGIKIFASDGYKLADETELRIEDEIFRHLDGLEAPDVAVSESAAVNDPRLRREYDTFLLAAVPGLSPERPSIVIDCANGAASAVAPELVCPLGGEIADPASTERPQHQRQLRRSTPRSWPPETPASGASLGITFDGDADRALFADANGNVVNGDAVLLLAARDLQPATARPATSSSPPPCPTWASRPRSNAAASRCFARRRRQVRPRADAATNAALGGEQSGHIIFSHLSTTGDGLLTALVVLYLVHRSGKPLHELCADLKVYPQVIVNVRVKEKKPLEGIKLVADAILAAETELKESGRVVIRYSGTEALARVMIEAESEEAMSRHAGAIADAIRNELGV